MHAVLIVEFARWLIIALPALVLISLDVDLWRLPVIPTGGSQTAIIKDSGTLFSSYPQIHTRPQSWRGITGAAAEVPILPPGFYHYEICLF
jgi:hypothetical protein